MKLPAIQKIIESNSLEALREAEQAILNEQQPAVELFGEDDGEQLTHCLAAIWILEEMAAKDCSSRDAIRAYAQRVRKSIS